VGRKRNYITNFWTQCPEVEIFSEGMYDTAMSRDWRTHGKENIYYGGRIGKMPESGGYLCRI
jgi:hypothetical protein